VDNSALAEALALTRESLAALQRMQEQASALHRQFLDGQDATHRTVAQLVEQQQRLLMAAAGQPLPPLPAPAPLPPPPRPTAWESEAPAAPVFPVGQASSLSEGSTGKMPVPRQQPVAPSAAPAPVVANNGHAGSILLEVIAEKTGYPAEMLGMEMSLDADLGIDSIKRVEILSALQERLPDAPPVKPEHLGSFHTLADIANFLAPATGPSPLPEANGRHTPKGSAVLLEVIAEKTGYPAEMLGMEMSLDADLGIDSIKRVEILSALQERFPNAPPVKPEQLGSFHTLADIAAFIDGPREVAPARPTEPAPVAVAQPGPGLERSVVEVVPVGPRNQRGLNGPVWVVGSDAISKAVVSGLRHLGGEVIHTSTLPNSPSSLGAMVIIAPPDTVSDAFLRDALFAVQTAGPGLRAARGLLLTVSRLDGAFGLGGGTAWREPLDGALAGLAKTAGQEWKEITVRTLDLSPALENVAAVEAIEREMFLDGPVEVGISSDATVTLRVTAQPLLAGNFVPFRPGDLVVVSGGARGVTAEAALALARQFRPTLLLLGRSPEPGPEPDWLAGLPDEPAIKRELARRSPGRPPREVGEQAKLHLAQREVRQNLARMREAGARVLYRSADVRDATAVVPILREAREAHGPIRGLIHGAGVLADARIEDKTPAQFDAVWGTKVDGLRALLAGCDEEELRAVVLFSSSTGRFGRTGQVDYAMANEALNKMAWRLARPGRRVVSINWGPWEGGMVTPGLRKLFASEGIGLIPLEAGARLMCDELRQPPEAAREVVVLGPTQAVPAATKLPAALPLAFERVASLDELPVVRHHVLDGRGVLPFALMLEWLAHAALAQNAGFVFHGADDLRVLNGVFIEGAPFTLRVGAGKATRKDGLFVAPAELRSVRDGREVLHARADILLANSLPPAPEPQETPELPPYTAAVADVYRKGLLFHGPAMHAFTTIEGMGEAGAVAKLKAAPPPGQWLKQPLRQHWLTDPLVLDGCFQLAILWGRQQRGAAGLPCHVRRYRQYRKGMPATGARALLTLERATELHAVAGLQLVDEAGQVLAIAEGYEFVLDPALERAYRRNQLVPA
jgi:NAD(P)-dependent dehydrogenase (short-subunit alcohol dehydrogenase family)/acyl carrier protein